MVKKQLLYRAAAATVLGLSLTTGGAVFADGNGYHHDHNNHHGNNSLTASLSANVSKVGVNNVTNQNAQSGPAVVAGSSSSDHHSYNYGDHSHNNNNSTSTAATGAVDNYNTTAGTVNVTQKPAPTVNTASQDTNTHHDDGNNTVDVSASVNVSSVNINNVTNQNAQSGPATVTGNNKVGDAKTGPASNSNNTTLTVNVKQ